MNRAVKYGTAIVLVHLLVNIAHAAAHLKLHIELGLAAMLFVMVVIVLLPLIAMLVLWTSRERLGVILLALSMSASLIFGLYNHFVAAGPDHVGEQATGTWGTTFVLTAYLLLVTEAIGTYVGFHFLYRKMTAWTGICSSTDGLKWLPSETPTSHSATIHFGRDLVHIQPFSSVVAYQYPG